MVFVMEDPNLKWMTGGTPMTKRKLPYVVILVPELGILIEQAKIAGVVSVVESVPAVTAKISGGRST